MSLPMCSLQPQFAFYVQQRRVLVRNLHKRLHFGPKPNTQFLFSEYSSKNRFGYVTPVKSASDSVNGYPFHNYSKERSLEGDDAELGEKFRKWIGFARDFLPGGSWWRLSSEDVDVQMTAQPVTVIRALQKMWELIAQDRWLIFSAFAALVVTAVCSLFNVPSLHAFCIYKKKKKRY